ncbi:MAG: CehA/McbA family metallohydrolase [Clostridia bacterium]|nr:CehA/McbA family metallohydrolase [Clostridia bacterium]
MKHYYVDPALPQWKGNFHCHTTQSDGSRPPQEVADLYAQAGYDFLALTDHRKVVDPASIDAPLLLIPGIELDYVVTRRHAQAVHLIGVGVGLDLMSAPGVMESPQQGIDAIIASGGKVIFAHPAWSLNDPEEIEELKGISAVEVYNHMSDEPWNGRRGDSTAILDLCCAHGFCLPFVAGDDCHRYDVDQCHSALIVSAPELTREGVLSALEQGLVYASQGPQIKELFIEDGVVTVRCTAAMQIIFNSNAFFSRERVVNQRGVTEASYTLRPTETYIRVEITDVWGRRAWSSPISLR